MLMLHKLRGVNDEVVRMTIVHVRCCRMLHMNTLFMACCSWALPCVWANASFLKRLHFLPCIWKAPVSELAATYDVIFKGHFQSGGDFQLQTVFIRGMQVVWWKHLSWWQTVRSYPDFSIRCVMRTRYSQDLMMTSCTSAAIWVHNYLVVVHVS